MIAASEVSAVLVTRGDVDLDPVIASLPFTDIVVWDNSARLVDLAVAGRYEATWETRCAVTFVQDDDCILEPSSFEALLAAYESAKVTANMPTRFREHYPDSCLVGFGALFDRHLPRIAFDRFWDSLRGSESEGEASSDHRFERTCDVVFTTLTERKLVDLPYVEREFASEDTRMWRQPGHHGERQQMLELARQVRDAAVVT